MQQKRHHYVSQFYLASWTHNGSKTGRLFVTDAETGKQRPGTPKNEANVRGLYTIESRENPLIVENVFSKVEDHIAPMIRQIEDSQELPTNAGDFASLLHWIGLQHQKVLRMREVHEKYHDQLARTMLGVITQSDQVFEQVKRRMKADGEGIEDASREDLRDALPHLKFQVDTTTLVDQMLHGAQVVADGLERRSWTLLVAPKGSVPDFITSDNPVMLVPTKKNLIGVHLGFAFPDTAVLYSLTPRLAVCGEFSDDPPRKKDLTLAWVANFNEMMVQSAERYIYSRRTRICHKLDGELRYTYKGRPKPAPDTNFADWR